MDMRNYQPEINTERQSLDEQATLAYMDRRMARSNFIWFVKRTFPELNWREAEQVADNWVEIIYYGRKT